VSAANLAGQFEIRLRGVPERIFRRRINPDGRRGAAVAERCGSLTVPPESSARNGYALDRFASRSNERRPGPILLLHHRARYRLRQRSFSLPSEVIVADRSGTSIGLGSGPTPNAADSQQKIFSVRFPRSATMFPEAWLRRAILVRHPF